MKRNIGIFFLALTLIVAFSGLTAAEDKAADNMELVKQKIRTDKKLFVAENMELTEVQDKAFWPVYESYQADHEKLIVSSVKLIENFAMNYETMSDETAKKLLEEWLAIDADELKLRQSYVPKFRKVLPDIKVARYFQIESKIDAINRYVLAAKIPLFK